MIDYYKFEVKPWAYNIPNGAQAKLLEVTVQINGEEYKMERMIPNQKPFETEVEYYTRIATSTLHDKLRELEKNP